MDEVSPEGLQLEAGHEVQVRHLHLVQVQLQDGAVERDDAVRVHHVHEWLRDAEVPHAGHVDSVDVVPELDFFILVLGVLNGSHHEAHCVWEHQPTLLQPLVPCEHHRVQHALVQQEVPHPLCDYDVDLPHLQLHFLHSPRYYADHLFQVVVPHDLLAYAEISAFSMPMTFAAPARAAKMLMMPVPQPIS
eukprot:CAMPEP_0201285870 /NCGR_PEP_ID=MMETSP1317-20130820/113951_1 /ASSEMBLY_ACC=CAM_ASM_000770 /TAXON_ID=187299 /ORGANISM="Undescribed Undescribed, Strain Undescribed" /LENGTH=189 /DNA_ID=CAMNT_0047611995 /DNA_START=1211 /DNA_END=1777 /DNA_ORIENTATION=+